MAITVHERFLDLQQDTGNGGQSQKLYVVEGTDVSADAMAAMWNEAPTTFDVLGDGSIIHHRHSVTDWNRVNEQCWRGAVVYRPTNWELGRSKIRFSLGGGTQHITQSRSTTPYGPESADHGNAIEPDSEGNIKGCEIPGGGLRFTLDVKLPEADVTTTLIAMLADMVGTTNSTPWRGFLAKAVCLLGVDGDQQANGEYILSFQFEAKKVVTGESVTLYDPSFLDAETTVSINYTGWQYVWFKYYRTIAGDPPCVVTRPSAVFVEDVLYSSEFDELPLGA